ncbi:DsbA family oxidoreductase [Paenibacillus sp. MAH-36]|uniref:DsbA family oxidoreductase n=1 Tax=Paenibacillus violae TaxID=3077234 RepID=A0ABU3RQL0_9BACL|nr:DsbA family oxidoreductase [Paenibacillus sp. PFR10]MDU0206498.1 DsbA family oxidoreductase [Paenibacillus sp. PFR10]
MKIEVWTDIVCPYCYIGKRKFEEGLKKFKHRDSVEIVYRSFELDPHMAVHVNDDIYGLSAKKFGSTRAHMKAVHDDITKRAELDGLTFNYDTAIHTNTFNAHRLLHYSAQFGKTNELLERLYKAYFTDSLHIGDANTLVMIAIEVGLDAAGTAAMLDSEQYVAEVRADELKAQKLGVRGVPYFLMNGKYAISGAQSKEVFAEALEKAWAEEHPVVQFRSAAGDTEELACLDGSCAVEHQELNKQKEES